MKDAITEWCHWRSFKSIGDHTLRCNEKELLNLCLFLRNPEIEDVTFERVMQYLELKHLLGWKQNTFIQIGNHLKKFFEFSNMRGYGTFDENLIPVPQKEYKIPRVATKEEYKKLLAVVPKYKDMSRVGNNDMLHMRNLAIIKLLWDTGARNGEILSLDLDDLDLENKKALIKTEKAKTRRPIREIFWTQETNFALKKWLTARERLTTHAPLRDPNALFISIHNSGSQKTKGYRFRASGVCEMLRNYSNKAGLPIRLNAHSMRHYMGRSIIEQGGSNSDVTNILGHSCIESSMVYTMMYGKQAERRYRKFRGK